MEVTNFTNSVLNVIDDLKKELGVETDFKNPNKQFSDIIDDEGLQYVDIVMEGGGVLGIALVGYTYVLEQVGIRFFQIGGTSAGAINAMLLAGMGAPAEAKSEKILEKLAEVDMKKFIDGDDDAKGLISAWLEQEFDKQEGNVGEMREIFNNMFDTANKWQLYGKALQVIDNINNGLGLNPGIYFEKWVAKVLKDENITTTKQLKERLSKLPKGFRHRDGKPITDSAQVALIAADVSTQTKAIFPEMAEFYWKDHENVNPSKYVRASMSIPVFFNPFHVDDIPDDADAIRRWRQKSNYTQPIPKTCSFIDGGIMSNFPIYLFHKPYRVPPAPTFGVKIQEDERNVGEITSPLKLLRAIFDCSRFSLDNDFINVNPDYQKLVCFIDTKNHYWLNFNMSTEDKVSLFKQGADAAISFLRNFDWLQYKKIREQIAQSVEKSGREVEKFNGPAVQTTEST